ncbi:phage tail family protein [Bacillus sp. ISL-75]|uniref:phage distal tail protein n=1 Tax=Bacillus sp. ISL-75 TaxID=2819137 RepID=UPI001BE83AAD|nr:phage tail domain-containing protein [Bacillus sp. ISL-75]MBT2727834.1 phage tail family protein [Bacillus sp. ISL-75]
MVKETITWIDPNGVEYVLTQGERYDILNGVKGFYMPPIEVIEEEVPFQAGSRLRAVKVKSRDIDVPLKISAPDEVELLYAMRRLLQIFNPLKGNGKFRVSAVDGSQRELSCLYLGGLELEESDQTKGKTWLKAISVFKAFDPYWYDSNSIVQTFKINEAPGTFFPIFPLRLSSSTVFADISIDNSGDVETWPEWIITGPGENIVLRNMSTGDVMNLETSIGVGETIIIDTKPYAKTVTKNDGANLFYTLTDESSLWSIQEGENSIQLEMANATTESSIQLTYRNRYWGP